MQIQWREIDNSDGSKALFGAFKVNDLEEACVKANKAIKIIKAHREDEHSHMALSHEGLTIMLYGISKQVITDSDWAIAKEIQTALSS